MLSMAFLLLAAGSKTTTHLISGAVFELLGVPGLARLAGAGPGPRRARCRGVPALRLTGALLEAALCAAGYRAHGVRLKRRSRSWSMLAAANMDPAVQTSAPERPDLERRPNRHISFGTGIHFCLGHHSHGSRPPVRWRRCSRDGRSCGSRSIQRRSTGAAAGPARDREAAGAGWRTGGIADVNARRSMLN